MNATYKYNNIFLWYNFETLIILWYHIIFLRNILIILGLVTDFEKFIIAAFSAILVANVAVSFGKETTMHTSYENSDISRMNSFIL